MHKILRTLLILITSTAWATNLPISTLPLGSGSGVGATDSFPYYNISAAQPYRLKLSDLVNVPAFQTEFSLFAPLASPTFTGTVVTPALQINATSVSGYVWTATDTVGHGHWAVASGGFTNPMTTAGDLILGGAAGAAGRLAIGSNTYVLTSNGTTASWAAPTGGFSNPMTTLGDTLYGGASGAATRLAGDTSNSRKFMLEQSSSSVATAPVWSLLTSADIPNNAANTTGTAGNVTGVVALANGGTGTAAGSANTAFNALAPTTTKGDVIVNTGSVNARHAVPSDYGAKIPDSNATDGWRNANYLATGKGQKNYIQYNDFENGVSTGWALGTVGTLTNGLPTGTPNFSGSTTSLSFGAENGAPLSGAWSMSYQPTAASTVGNMVATSAISIDPSDQAQALRVSFKYGTITGVSNVNYSGTSSNSFAWAVWDVTNSVWLSSVGNFCMNSTSFGATCNGASFQTGATTASIRFVFYNVNATAGAANIALDDFVISPQVYNQGYAGTDWVAYTPTFNGFGTPTGVSFFSRRVGGDLQVRGVMTTGTTTAVTAEITLGYNGGNGNVTIDTSKIGGNTVLGAFALGTGQSISTVGVLAPTTSVNYVQFGAGGSTGGSASFTNGNAFASSSTFTFDASVPIVGWSSNTATSADSNPMPTVAIFNGSSTSVTNSNTTIVPTTITKDTCGGYTGSGIYTICSTGFYTLNASLQLVNVSESSLTLLYQQNSNSAVTFAQEQVTTPFPTISGSVVFYANAGDTIKILGQTSTSAAVNFYLASITKSNGSNAVQAPPTEAFSAYGSTTSMTTSYAALIQPTKVTDTVNMYSTSTGLGTVRDGGTWHCDCNAFFGSSSSATATYNLQFWVAGSSVGPSFQGYTGNNYGTVQASFDMPVLSGQTIGCYGQVNVGTSPITSSSFSCHRVGY